METLYRPPDRSKYLLADEVARLLASARRLGAFEHAVLSFVAATGVRPSEANKVRAADVHAAENRVRVRTLKQHDARERQRDVDLAPAYARTLEAWLKRRSSDKPLFARSRVTLWKIFKRAARAARLSPTYTLYSLRHTRAIYLLEWTGDLDYTSKQLGHSSISVTSQYLHCIPSKRAAHVKRLRDFAGGA